VNPFYVRCAAAVSNVFADGSHSSVLRLFKHMVVIAVLLEAISTNGCRCRFVRGCVCL